MNESAFYQKQLSRAVAEVKQARSEAERLRNMYASLSNHLEEVKSLLQSLAALRRAVCAVVKRDGDIKVGMALVDAVTDNDLVRAEVLDEPMGRTLRLYHETRKAGE